MALARRLVLCAGLTPVLGGGHAGVPLRVAGSQDPGDQRFRYGTRLLRLALTKAGMEVQLLAKTGLTQPRQARELHAGNLDVGQLPANISIEGLNLLPVRVPIRRGLLGLRLLLARKADAAAVGQVSSVAELQKRYTLGHGADWVDLESMRRAGFRVVPLAAYTKLFRGLESGRYDLLSRSVSEVWDELDSPGLAGGGQLAIVPNVALFYPLDDFFWVNPRRPELAQALRAGLALALSDGSFAALFRETYRSALERANLGQRQIFPLPGLESPLDTPLNLADVVQELRTMAGAL
jgi:hypothetical protein